MVTHKASSDVIAHQGRRVDLQAKLYREIGISAVAAAVEWTRRPQKVTRAPTVEIPAVLRDTDAA
jgi:hypothetical protein